MAITAAMLATAACSDEVVNDVDQPVPDSQKEKIEFSMTDELGGSITRSQTRAGFEAQTKIVMRMRSKDAGTNYRYTRTIAKAAAQASSKAYSTVSFDTDYIRYWDDAFGRNANLSVFAVAVPGKNDDVLLPASILAEPTGAFVNNTKWFTESSENEKTTTWTVTTNQQDLTTIAKEDLVYSNNIQPTNVTPAGFDGVYTYDFTQNKYFELANDITNIAALGDGCMTFQLKDSSDPSGIGKFNKGHLIFQHALSRITVNLKKGAGYTETDAFAFTTDTDIKLNSFPVKGVLDVEKGSWTLDASAGSSDIARMASMSPETGIAYKYMAQVLPGYIFKDGVTDNVMQFTIDNNTYYVTKDMVFDALTKDASNNSINTTEVENGNQITMKSGKNYVLTITVGKTKIESLTCTLVPWTVVNAENQTPSNSRITLSLLPASGSACESFDIYRLPEAAGSITDAYDGTAWDGNYTDKATTLSRNTDYETNKSWTTNWFFDSNSTYYHFRTVNTGTTIKKTDGQKDDYFEVSAGAVADTDPHWGAPFKSGSNLKYDLTYGWSAADKANSQIAHAIGSTTNTIAITENHMMSNVYVVLKTVTGNGAVELYNETTKKGAIVKLTNFCKDGKVAMGTGLITPTATVTASQKMTVPTETSADTYYATKPVTGESPVAGVSNQYSFAFVPQSLVRNNGAAVTDFVGITITTPDDNEYYVEKLSLINAESVGTETNMMQSANSVITQWCPGHKYIYTFTISKKGIEAITCSLVDWTTVTAGNTDLDLEK